MSDTMNKILEAEMPIVVTASAGTGKTHTLVNKVNKIVESGVSPINILVFSFTVDASEELRSRITNGQLMTIGTIHSVMFQIVREHSPKRYYVLDNGDQMKFAFRIFKELKIDYDKYNKYMGTIELAKNIFPDYYELLENNSGVIDKYFNDSRLLSFANEFERERERCHKICFSDMPLKAYQILKNNPSVLEHRQERWKYIFLDEAQDASRVDVAIILLLANKYRNLFIVGDIKQKIYGFRTG